MRLALTLLLVSASLSVFSLPPKAKRKLELCRLFSDHMVLQQQQHVEFWGHAVPGQQISIAASWGSKAFTRAGDSGDWKVKLATTKAGGPYNITIETSDSTILINDILLGEVWLASGQSNMDLPVSGWPPEDTVFNSANEIADANYPNIRLIKVPFNISARPIDSIGGSWLHASPKTVGDFSATAYFYARKLYQELHVPIGIIQSSIGGTPAEAWTSGKGLKKIDKYAGASDRLGNVQDSVDNWFGKWPHQDIPTTNSQWQGLSFNDLAAAETGFDDSEWMGVHLPSRIDVLGDGEFDGAVWIRKNFIMDDVDTGYILKIGYIDDMEAVYVNGYKIGGLAGPGFAATAREFVIPKNILIKGSNIIAIRVIDTGGPGGVSGPITISNSKGGNISLEGVWKYRLVAEIKNKYFYVYDLKANFAQRPNVFQLNSNTPSVLFNAMINPLIPYRIKGAIWYQGESNVGRAEEYKKLFPALIEDWREGWGYGFPFYFVQIAPHLYKASDQKEQSQKLRDAQRYALTLPRTGMAVTLDIGKLETAHPAFKQEVGERLARFALANDYGKHLTVSGPLYKKATVSGNSMIVGFDFIGSGLAASDKGLFGFEIAGADKRYSMAKATIINDKIVVSNISVVSPMYVRYAWSDGAAASLFNKEGLPAGTFSSEE